MLFHFPQKNISKSKNSSQHGLISLSASRGSMFRSREMRSHTRWAGSHPRIWRCRRWRWRSHTWTQGQNTRPGPVRSSARRPVRGPEDSLCWDDVLYRGFHPHGKVGGPQKPFSLIVVSLINVLYMWSCTCFIFVVIFLVGWGGAAPGGFCYCCISFWQWRRSDLDCQIRSVISFSAAA